MDNRNLERCYDQKGDWEEHNDSMNRFLKEPHRDCWGNITSHKDWDGDLE